MTTRPKSAAEWPFARGPVHTRWPSTTPKQMKKRTKRYVSEERQSSAAERRFQTTVNVVPHERENHHHCAEPGYTSGINSWVVSGTSSLLQENAPSPHVTTGQLNGRAADRHERT